MWTVELAKAASLHYMVFLVCFPISLSWFKVYYCQFYYLFLGQSSYSGARNKSVMEPMFALQCWLKTCVSGVPLFWFNSATYSELWDHECASSAAVITVLKAEGGLVLIHAWWWIKQDIQKCMCKVGVTGAFSWWRPLSHRPRSQLPTAWQALVAK